MPAYVALLRAVNIGAHKKVAMADLRDLAGRLGYDEPKTLLNSGNLLFRSKASSTAKIEQALEAESKKRLGLDTEFYVRSPGEWEAVVAANPFSTEARKDPGHLMLLSLRKSPTTASVEALRAAIKGPETIRPGERCLYMVYPAGVGTSKLTNAVIARWLGEPGTARNWNTVLKVQSLLSAPV